MRIYPRPTPSRSLFKHWRAPIELDIKDEHPRACPTCPLMCPPQNTFTSRHIRCFYIPNAGCFTHIDCIAKKTVSAGQGMQQSMWKCRSTRRSAVEQHDAWRAAMEVIIGVIAPDCGNVKQCVCAYIPPDLYWDWGCWKTQTHLSSKCLKQEILIRDGVLDICQFMYCKCLMGIRLQPHLRKTHLHARQTLLGAKWLWECCSRRRLYIMNNTDLRLSVPTTAPITGPEWMPTRMWMQPSAAGKRSTKTQKLMWS